MYCTGTDISGNNGESIYVKADEVTSGYNINSTNGKAYTNSSIKINYVSVINGSPSDVGCIDTTYCSTNLSTTTSVSCNYTTQQTDTAYNGSSNDGYNTYYTKACDDEGACSVYRQGYFFINYKTEMNITNLTTTNHLGEGYLNFTEDSNLNCTHINKTDLWNRTPISYTYKWYYNRLGSFVLYDSNLPSTTKVLSNGHTEEGDQWICEVTPNDGFVDGFPLNSSTRYIGASSEEGNSLGIPYIINVTDNSNWTNPTTYGENITFEIAWGDSNSSQIYAFICNSSNIDGYGCTQPLLAWSGPGTTSNNPVNVSFATKSIWDKKNITAYVYIFDDDWINSTVKEENFSVNTKPEMLWVNLTTTNGSEIIMNDKNLNCTHKNKSDSWTKDGGGITFTYKWYYNITGSFEPHLSTSQTLAKGATNEGEQWICEVTPNDGFVDGTPVNSSTRIIGQSGTINQDGIPEIISIIDNSNLTNPTTYGENVTFQITWGDSNSSYLNMILICNSTNVESSGCLETE